MRFGIYVLAIFFGMLGALSMSAASNWDKNYQKQFKKAKEYNVIIDLKDVQYDGLDSLQFVDYAASVNNTTPDKIGVALRFLNYEVLSNVRRKLEPKLSLDDESQAEIVIKIRNINYKAGLDAEVYCRYNGVEVEKARMIRINDGRWNTFERLIKENSEELAEKVVMYIKHVRFYGW